VKNDQTQTTFMGIHEHRCIHCGKTPSEAGIAKCEPEPFFTPPVQKEAAERIEKLDAAYRDAISALRYIRLHYGDLYGVGWARLDETYVEVCNE
jgi:hypothetical protein